MLNGCSLPGIVATMVGARTMRKVFRTTYSIHPSSMDGWVTVVGVALVRLDGGSQFVQLILESLAPPENPILKVTLIIFFFMRC